MSPEPQRLEDKLRCLSLALTALDRDTLLFEAGRRSAKPARGWKFASLASCLIAVGTMSLHFLTPVERIVYVTAPQSAPQELVAMQPAEPATEAQPESAWSLFQLRQQAIQQTSFVPAVLPAEDKPLQPLTVGSSLTLFPAP
jgi:hypothetical protein